MTTAQTLIDRVRSRLNEATATFWTDAEFITWMNEGMRDCARFTRHIRDTDTVTVVADTQEYTIASDVIEVDKVYWLPDGQDRQVPLTGMSYDTLDNVWGQWQNISEGDPSTYALWGVPPLLKIKLWPTPDVAGTLSVYVIRMPAAVTVVGDTIDWPPAWEDLVEDYMEMCALRKDRDRRWRECHELYANKRDNLDVNGFYGSDPESILFDGYAGAMPRWLVDPHY